MQWLRGSMRQLQHLQGVHGRVCASCHELGLLGLFNDLQAVDGRSVDDVLTAVAEGLCCEKCCQLIPVLLCSSSLHPQDGEQIFCCTQVDRAVQRALHVEAERMRKAGFLMYMRVSVT